MTELKRVPVYRFRDAHFSAAQDTAACAAPQEVVVRVFGGGGLYDTDGLSAAFGGAAVYRDAGGKLYLGVWRTRKTSQFRSALRRAGIDMDLLNEAPPGRLICFGKRPQKTSRRQLLTRALNQNRQSTNA